MVHRLDDVDRGILYLLQMDARNTTSQDIADKVGVSASTVRNRIDRLEADGVIKGYQPEIDYEAADLQLRIMFVVTAPPKKRTEIVDRLMDVKGVVDVAEMLTGRHNIQVEVVARNATEIARITDSIHDIGVEVESSEIIKQRKQQPFNHFYFSADAGTDSRADEDDEDDEK